MRIILFLFKKIAPYDPQQFMWELWDIYQLKTQYL